MPAWKGRGLYLNKWTQETNTFPQPYIIVEGKYAPWSQAMLDTAFQTPCWYLIPWNWGKVCRAHQIMRMVPFTWFKSITLTKPSKEGKRNHTSGQGNPSKHGLVIFSSSSPLQNTKMSLCLHILKSMWVVSHLLWCPRSVKLQQIGQCEWWEETRIRDEAGASRRVLEVWHFLLAFAKK